MSLHLVTGYAGQAHVTPVDVAGLNKAMVTRRNVVFANDTTILVGNESINSAFAASVIDNNTVRIYSGELMLQGRHIRMNAGTYEDVTIETGAIGAYRKDLIVVRYTRDPLNANVETAQLLVIKGTVAASAGAAQIPSYQDFDIDSAESTDFPLWTIPVNEITIGTPERMFNMVGNMYPAENRDVQSMVDLVYPVGSIYMSVNPTNPGSLFGGTWVSWCQGGFPAGVTVSDPTDPDFGRVEQNPRMSQRRLEFEAKSITSGTEVDVAWSPILNVPTIDGVKTQPLLPWYTTCYMWKRTA